MTGSGLGRIAIDYGYIYWFDGVDSIFGLIHFHFRLQIRNFCQRRIFTNNYWVILMLLVPLTPDKYPNAYIVQYLYAPLSIVPPSA